MSELQSYVDQLVCVVTVDGRIVVGTLKGFDQTTNVILDQCHERIFSLQSGVKLAPLGLYILRGDNVASIGEVDSEKDASLEFDEMKAEPLPPIRHQL